MKRVDLILVIEYIDNLIWFISTKCLKNNLDSELVYIFTRLLSDIAKWQHELRKIKDNSTRISRYV